MRRGRIAKEPAGQVEPVDRVEKEQRPDPFIKVLAAAAEGVQGRALVEQGLKRQLGASGVQGAVAQGRVGGGDDGKQLHNS